MCVEQTVFEGPVALALYIKWQNVTIATINSMRYVEIGYNKQKAGIVTCDIQFLCLEL